MSRPKFLIPVTFLVILVALPCCLGKKTLPKNDDADEDQTFDLVLPDPLISRADTYLCSIHPFDRERMYIRNMDFILNSKRPKPHHIAFWMCKVPRLTKNPKKGYFGCGPDYHGETPEGYVADSANDQNLLLNLTNGMCLEGPKMVYGWGVGVPGFKFPEGTAFEVGSETSVPLYVVQLHYTHAWSAEELATKRKKGQNVARLTYRTTPEPKILRYVLVVTRTGIIPPNTNVSMEITCSNIVHSGVQTVAFRVHSHTHGRAVTVFRVRKNKNTGSWKWKRLGEYNPLDTQHFRTQRKNATFNEGDLLAIRCVFENEEDREIKIGPGEDDEMCNVHIMYWTAEEKGNEEPAYICSGDGPPFYSWATDKKRKFDNIPEAYNYPKYVHPEDTENTLPGEGHEGRK